MHVIEPHELAALARKALASAGIRQTQAAAELGLSQGVISKAVSGVSGQDPARLRIIARYGGLRLRGPVYVVEEPGQEPPTGPLSE